MLITKILFPLLKLNALYNHTTKGGAQFSKIQLIFAKLFTLL